MTFSLTTAPAGADPHFRGSQAESVADEILEGAGEPVSEPCFEVISYYAGVNQHAIPFVAH